MTEVRQGPTPCVHFNEVYVKRELTVFQDEAFGYINKTRRIPHLFQCINFDTLIPSEDSLAQGIMDKLHREQQTVICEYSKQRAQHTVATQAQWNKLTSDWNEHKHQLRFLSYKSVLTNTHKKTIWTSCLTIIVVCLFVCLFTNLAIPGPAQGLCSNRSHILTPVIPHEVRQLLRQVLTNDTKVMWLWNKWLLNLPNTWWAL